MRLRFLARKTHKWLALTVGIQVLLWVVSGLYMTVIHIDYIHGDHLVKTLPPAVLADKRIAPLPDKVFRRYGQVSEIKLTVRLDKAVYLLTTEEGKIVLDAASGDILNELDRDDISILAAKHYAGQATVVQVRRLEQYPSELGGRAQPIWEVAYDDWLASTLYFDVNSGRLAGKRSDLWRWFDFLWMLHIMDYETRDDINNSLLRVASILGFIMSISGLMLVWYRLRPGSNKP
ncbi:MAG: putative iron-regulated membrane protein [Alteromonadaceae bacterium]|jgi:uncharacterized iron-regulated membrane protein